MTARAKEPTAAMASPAPLVLFGMDSRGKPKAARFGKEHAGLAIKAAGQLQLNVLASKDPKVAEIAARLPVGRVHATGRTFVPFVRRDLYDKLLAAAANGNPDPVSPPNGSSGASGSTPGGSAPHLPQTWQSIGIGDLVVANDSREDGWYEAIVVEANGDMLTLRWRDYPRERRIVRHRLRLGLMYPEPQQRAENGKSAKAPRRAKHDKPVATKNQPPTANRYPRIGARAAWWEAIPVEKDGDLFKLRWRDNAANVPSITRQRFDLALICPDAA